MSKKMDDEVQKAFAEGQEAWRHGKGLKQNPHHKRVAADSWNQGWEAEEAIQQK